MDQANHLYDLKMKQLDQRAMELQMAEEDCRNAINVATKDYNLALVCDVKVCCWIYNGLC